MAAAQIPDTQAPIHQLAIKDIFDPLTPQEKIYAHHLSRAAWKGSRIILRQTSAEAEDIFDLIIGLFYACDGKWDILIDRCSISKAELDAFLAYAGLFLCNLGNFYGEGGQKFVPNLSKEKLKSIAQISIRKPAEHSLDEIIAAMTSLPPYGLGFPSETASSNYYLSERFTREEIAAVSKELERHGLELENTRLRKVHEEESVYIEVLQASIETDSANTGKGGLQWKTRICIVGGDHVTEMTEICSHLEKAISYAANDNQTKCLLHYLESFRTGSLNAFRESQKHWVRDISPSVENIIGFVEPYRDPYGVRAEWEGVICIADATETKKMKEFVDQSAYFTSLLPWATQENNGKGPFEKNLLDIPDFTIIHALAFCASHVWEAANLPNYNDIREEFGSKNLLIANRMNANRNSAGSSKYLSAADSNAYRTNLHIIRFVATVIHELLGHGTGKLLSETESGKFNFDRTNPPINPLTGRKVDSWYLPGQTWTTLFEDLATTVEECRATAMSAYIVDHKDLLQVFGYNDKSNPTADELIYLSYLHLGVEGVRSLEHYSTKDQMWTEAHSQGYFAIFKQLLLSGGGVMQVHYDPEAPNISVSVDRTKILSHGKSTLGQLLLRLHIWRCTADVKSCREFYEQLTAVDGKYEEWRKFVCSRPEPKWKFVQPNTFLVNGQVELKTYEESNAGVIQSWVERDI